MLTNFINIERLIHSIKTVIACVIAFLVTKIIELPADQWVVITVIVVMCAQIYVGSVMQKAYLRFLGTLAGCLFAALTLTFIGDSSWAILLAISVSSFAFSYIATKGENLVYTGTLGAVTTAIIMLGANPTLLVAFERFIEISIGILIATVVSQFILPINARTHLRRSQATTLGQLRDYYTQLMINRFMDKPAVDQHDLDESIVKSLMKQRQLAKESVREPLGLAFNPARFTQTLYCEREMLRAITFMHDALIKVKKIDTAFLTLNTVQNFNQAVTQTLTTFVSVIESDNVANHHIHIPTLFSMKEELLKIIDAPNQEELLHIDGFLFSAEILTTSLIKLAHLFQIPIAGGSTPV